MCKHEVSSLEPLGCFMACGAEGYEILEGCGFQVPWSLNVIDLEVPGTLPALGAFEPVEGFSLIGECGPLIAVEEFLGWSHLASSA